MLRFAASLSDRFTTSQQKTVFRFLLMIVITNCLALSSTLSAKDKKEAPVNLLKLPKVTITETSLQDSEKDQLKFLRDGKTDTVASLPASKESPLEIVFSFNKQTVSPEILILTSPDQKEKQARVYRIDLLVSEQSATSGFRKLRTEYPDAKKQIHNFKLPPSGAKWILLRFLPMPGNDSVSIAEIELSGHAGPPVSRYEFKESPANSFQVLKKLKNSESITISPDEENLVEDARDGKLDQWTFAEAALLASGVTESRQREVYLRQIAQYEKQLNSILDKNLSDKQKGAKLLEWLHKGPLSKGYVSKQTDLSVILDTNTYNCVSSAVLYNILAKKFHLDVRAIEVPDHAFAILYKGSESYDIETTTPYGFNPSRDKAAQKQFEQKTGFRYIPDRHRDQRREINEPGLIALIYYNHGVQLDKEKKHHKALLSYFKALSLDPEFDSAVKNVLASLANWGLELSKEAEFEQAVNTIATGLLLAPKDATLLNNRNAIWSQWAQMEMDNGNDSKALEILKKADKAVPDANFLEMQSWVYIRKGENRIKQNQWDEVIPDIEDGFAKLEPAPKNELELWKTNFYLRYSNNLIKKQDFEKAGQVLLDGLKWQPDENRYPNNLGYLTQEWIQHAYNNEGLEKAELVITKIQKDLGEIQDSREAIGNFYIRTVNKLSRKGEFEQALKIANKSKDFTDKPETTQKLIQSTYDSWSRSFQKKNQWKKSLEIYETAIKLYPEDKHLKNNYLSTWSGWARSFRKDKNWEKEFQVYETAIKQIPDEKRFLQNIGYVVQEWGKDIYRNKGYQDALIFIRNTNDKYGENQSIKKGINVVANRIVEDFIKKSEYEKAEKAIKELSVFLPEKRDRLRLAYMTYDVWASKYTKKNDWEKATDIYSKAIKAYPKDSHFIRNSTATWNEWANSHIKKKQWKEAIKIYQAALKKFPEERIFKNNLEYCQKNLKQ